LFVLGNSTTKINLGKGVSLFPFQGVYFLAFRNEQSMGYTAAAYDFLMGSSGALLTVSNPGCVHGLEGLSHATTNAWPLLMISGSCDQADADRGNFQELDQIAATKPFIKLAVKATTIADIPRLVFQALAAAVFGRPRRCYLDIPSDVLHQTLPKSEATALIAAAGTNSAASDPSPSMHNSLDEGITKAADLLWCVERPLVVVGKGEVYACVEEAIQKLVDTTVFPFLPTPMGKGVMPRIHTPPRWHAHSHWRSVMWLWSSVLGLIGCFTLASHPSGPRMSSLKVTYRGGE
jgi:2-hydroxyacyl-CoA lyase 1